MNPDDAVFPYDNELNQKISLWPGNSTPRPARRHLTLRFSAVVRLEIDGIQNAANKSMLGGGGSAYRRIPPTHSPQLTVLFTLPRAIRSIRSAGTLRKVCLMLLTPGAGYITAATPDIPRSLEVPLCPLFPSLSCAGYDLPSKYVLYAACGCSHLTFVATRSDRSARIPTR